MRIVRTPAELEPLPRSVLVPTMGGVHAGHASLVRLAAEHRAACALGPVIAGVFVNPAQFEESIDFDRYPRDLDTDAAALTDAGADAVFAPEADLVYPPGKPMPTPPPIGVADGPGLEDLYRPGHLVGVAQVLMRFFELVAPAAAVFGEKDWQQLRLATELAQQLPGGPEIVPAPTVREHDGLALSSRNRFLPPADRARAAAISEALCKASSTDDPAEAERLMALHLAGAGLTTEYATVRDAHTLREPTAGRPARALIAARLGAVRLIDNAPWG